MMWTQKPSKSPNQTSPRRVPVESAKLTNRHRKHSRKLNQDRTCPRQATDAVPQPWRATACKSTRNSYSAQELRPLPVGNSEKGPSASEHAEATSLRVALMRSAQYPLKPWGSSAPAPCSSSAMSPPPPFPGPGTTGPSASPTCTASSPWRSATEPLALSMPLRTFCTEGLCSAAPKAELALCHACLAVCPF
jgi:hypothetical protein